MGTRVYHQICRLLHHRRLSRAFLRCLERSLLLYLRPFDRLSLWNFGRRDYLIFEGFDIASVSVGSQLDFSFFSAFSLFWFFFFKFIDCIFGIICLFTFFLLFVEGAGLSLAYFFLGFDLFKVFTW
jgi:hypothetical protein